MKNILFLIVGLAVGFVSTYWYMKGSKSSTTEKGTLTDTSKMAAAKVSKSKVTMRTITAKEAKEMSDNYVNWILWLAKGHMADKSSKTEQVIRGGSLPVAALLELLKTAQSSDIHYVLGKDGISNAIYLVVAPDGTLDCTSDPTMLTPELQQNCLWRVYGDTASTCPPICPIYINKWEEAVVPVLKLKGN